MTKPMSTWPQQKRNISPGNAASAPYNFVPLPETVVPAVEAREDLPDHDTYDPARHTGHFEVTLTTRSPLYIRAPLTVEEFEQRSDDKPEFFYTRDEETPVVPGTSLQGMLRSLVEIASYGKMERVTEEPLFYRTMDRSSLSDHYTGKLQGNTETGFLRREHGQYVIKTCEMVRVPRRILRGAFGSLYQGSGPNKTPCWNGDCHQWKDVWVRRSSGKKQITDDDERKNDPEWDEGRLVITGDFPCKKKEFVFFLPDSDAKEFHVPDDLLERFHDDNQITQWQEEAFPQDQPERGCRKRDGMFRQNPDPPGDPVFFLRENGTLKFLGRAQMFRLPYENRPVDNVPDKLQDQEVLDYAESLFGYANGDPDPKEKASAYAGRISVTSARLEDGQDDIWYADAPVEPSVLSSPKPTCFQHYLVQDSADINQLKHYDNRPTEETIIRGHKLYWHQGDRPIPEDPDASPTQQTQFQPVDSGVGFSFRLDFENLSGAELGALCWALHPQGDPEKKYYHKLGMGKPLGMGAVELDATLHLDDRPRRYESLFDERGWATGEEHRGIRPDAERFQRFVSRFEENVLEKLASGGVDFAKEADRLRDLGRIGILLKMMEWPGPSSNTEYMELDEFRERPVLSSPADHGELTGYKGFEGLSAANGGRSPDFGGRQRGTVKWFSDKKGYGFILPDEGCALPEGEDVFVHYSNIDDTGYRTLEEGDQVVYDVEETEEGYQAVDVERIGS